MKRSQAATILGIDTTATTAEIRAAYKRRAQQAHPDRGGTAHEFQQVQEAFQTMQKPEETRQPFQKYHDYYSEVYNRGRFDDWYDRPLKPKLTVTCNLNLADTFEEHNRSIRIHHNGQTEIVPVRVPAGVSHGSALKIRPDNPDSSFWRSASIVFLVSVPENYSYEEQDLTTQPVLLGHVTVNAFAAMIGTSVMFTTADKKTLKLKIPAGTNSGTRLRVPGHGLYNTIKQSRDDLLVVVRVVTPQLSSADIAVIEQLGLADKYF